MTAAGDPRPGLDVNPRWLRAFLAVAQERHFGRAAALLSMGQPSLSRHVQQLERALGVQLFHRAAHGATLTEAGRLVLPDAENMLAQQSRLLWTARTYASTARSALTVAAPLPSAAGGLLAEAILRFRVARGHARVAVLDLGDEEQAGALVQHRVDAVLTWGQPPLAGLAAEPLVEEPVMGVVDAGHPLACDTLMPWSALAEDPLLFPVRERQYCWSVLSARANAAGTELNPVPTAPTAALALVAAGLGSSVVPASQGLDVSSRLAFVRLPELSVRMSVMWRQADQSAAVSAFVAACRSAATHLTRTRPDIWSPVLSSTDG
ncbi:LysR family transcriptional regulator [Streptomyces sp. NBC_01176]|uniref:LysR family transcriptional regulator n=1 Tax=Streptomyces sp. NBC_01176 TaxID=2903760 RepID=UPI002F916A6B|nr:LysR family transcriptional regulator [Streptomyces sp. NBC_01176]